MGESFQDFEDDFPQSHPQNPELRSLILASLVYFQPVLRQLTIET